MIGTEECEALFREYRKTRDICIRNRLVENYMYIAEIIAKKFAGRGVEYDDLLQIASEALISGVEKFDPDLGNKFTTYITPTLTGVIKNYFRDYSRSVRIPRRLYAAAARVKEETNRFYKEHGVKPTVKQLAKSLELSEELVVEALEYQPPVSLDARIPGENGDTDSPLGDVLPADGGDFEEFEDKESLRAEIEKLDPVEKRLINLRYVQGKSQAEAGKILGVSQMFVSRAERKIMERLRGALS